ncbi:hypothetical protein BYT27DRAFT_7335198 [Phlegmacium glaucopus]|nr:hypothetical protein BYT27DRAFT_7335198 [Phlegmacium glaucopus]
MVKLYLYVLTVVLATAPAHSFSNEYERRSSDSRDSAVLYGRDLDFQDSLWIRGSLPIAPLVRLIAGTAVHHTGHGILSHGGKSLDAAKTVSDIVANGYAAYHNGNPNNFNKPSHPAPSDLNVHMVQRGLEYDQELYGRDIDEEVFSREYYGLDERDIIDELD